MDLKDKIHIKHMEILDERKKVIVENIDADVQTAMLANPRKRGDTI